MLSLDQILERAHPAPTRDVEVPEWGGGVRVRGLTTRSRQALVRQAVNGGEIDETELAALMLVECLDEPRLAREEVDRLLDASVESTAAPIERIMVAIGELCGISEARAKELRASMFPGNGRTDDVPGGGGAGVPAQVSTGLGDDSRATGG